MVVIISPPGEYASGISFLKTGQDFFDFLNRQQSSRFFHDFFKPHDALFVDDNVGSITQPLFFVQPTGIILNHFGGVKRAQQRIIEFELLAEYFL